MAMTEAQKRASDYDDIHISILTSLTKGEVVDLLHCNQCGAIVVDMGQHIRWHKSINKKFADIPAHNWDLGGK